MSSSAKKAVHFHSKMGVTTTNKFCYPPSPGTADSINKQGIILTSSNGKKVRNGLEMLN